MSEPEDHLPQHLNDLWEDMDRLNAMYEELMWDHEVPLEFISSETQHSDARRDSQDCTRKRACAL